MPRLKLLPFLLVVGVILLTASTTYARDAQYKVLYRFADVQDGWFPNAGVTLDAAGNLYGTTYFGGNGDAGAGTVFKLTPNPDGTWTKITLYKFTGHADGGQPASDLIFDDAGNLYGTTAGGGAHKMGSVFKLAPQPDGSWKESVLYSFAGGADGAYPEAKVTLDATGNLYGTTSKGGVGCFDSGCGTVFNLTPNPDGSWAENVLYRFTGGKDGWDLYGGLTFDQVGNLYSTTERGGGQVSGTVFQLTPNPDGSWTQRTIAKFKNRPSSGPFAGVVFDQSGNLYGTTETGTVFRLTPNPDGTWAKSLIYAFRARPGLLTVLNLDAEGNLYGVTNQNTPNFVFELSPRPKGFWNFTNLHNFSSGVQPFSGLAIDNGGKLYGTTRDGGNVNCGGGGCGMVYTVIP